MLHTGNAQESMFHGATSRGAIGRNCLAQVGTMPITFGGVVGEFVQDCSRTLANTQGVIGTSIKAPISPEGARKCSTVPHDAEGGGGTPF